MTRPSNSRTRLGRTAALVLGLGASLVPAKAQLSGATPWDPSVPLPQFITHFFIDPANLVAIAKYRSGAGHVFSDDYEDPDRSMKNYYEPLPKYLNTVGILPEFVPANGTIISVTPEGQILSDGTIRGNQIALIPDGYPMFQITMFHCDQAANIVVGVHVNAGDPMGYADIRESQDVDFAVAATWNATPSFPSPGVFPTAGQVLKAPAYRLLSPFDLMSDSAFAPFAPYGLTDRSRVVVPLAYRNYNPGQFVGEDFANLDPIDFFILRVLPLVQNQPQSLPAVSLGSPATFVVTPALTGSPVAIQWNFNGVPIPGATHAVYTIQSVQSSNVGSYTATLTSFAGSTQSAAASLTLTQGTTASPGPVTTAGR